ncbi:MAG: hypothetical protein AAF961_07955 [Planctomycetota bacterium]
MHDADVAYEIDVTPLMFYYELAQTCDLECRRRRAWEQPLVADAELNGE